MADKDALLRKAGALRGIIFGFVLLAVNIALVYYTADVARSPVQFFIISFLSSFIIPAGLAVFFTNDLRKKVGGYWTLKQAITGIFFMLIVTYLISSTGRWVFSNYADVATIQKANTNTLIIQRQALESTHQPAQAIEETLNTTRKAMTEGQVFSVAHVIQTLLISIILIFAIAAILGALFKKEPPLLQSGYEK